MDPLLKPHLPFSLIVGFLEYKLKLLKYLPIKGNLVALSYRKGRKDLNI